ncbi:hypothetical protein AB0K00_53190 [Dactylosporangium sp. NPDC049525]|uniref:hypothetical protein n=1 Tax=Dactylosporangium sp. NPDC049525 TaxID=3154730 RepID=UPI00344345D9
MLISGDELFTVWVRAHRSAAQRCSEYAAPVLKHSPQAVKEPNMSDPYAPQPPNQPDPYQQQPYGAPQPGYSEQPSFGQPSYGQPSYGQPSYGEPSYGQPAYPQPSYPQPDYNAQPAYAPQAYPGQPGWGAAPTPPPKKSRTALIVTLVVTAVALVLCGGIAVIAFNLDSNKTTPNAAASGDPAAGPKSSSGSASKTPTLTAPATIGTWKKSVRQDQADALSKSLSDAGVKDPFAAQYEDKTKASKTAAVWGGTGAIFSAGGAQRQLDAFFTSMGGQLNGGQVTARIKVDPGSAGGTAECTKTDASGVTFSACAWVNTNVLLAFLFNALEPDAAGAQVRLMLPALVINN